MLKYVLGLSEMYTCVQILFAIVDFRLTLFISTFFKLLQLRNCFII